MSAKIRRLGAEELSPALQAMLAPRVARLGYLGEFLKCAGHQPAVLAPFIEMTEALKHALPDRLTEIVALTVAVLMGNAYERHQHERLSTKLGFGADWIRAVIRLDPEASTVLDDADRAVQRLVVALIERRGHGVRAELEVMIDALGPEQAVAILFLVGRYATHAYFVNAFELAPPIPSIFEEPGG